MKYLFLLFVALLSCFSSIAQSTPQLPEITPTTPEAGSLGRFGNVPIDPSTGQMSYSVPIHTIEIDGHSWPISLQYNYGGFIPETKPSLSGWGWTLNAYGSVSKQTRGLPDFHPNGYYGANNVKAKFEPYVDNGTVYEMPVSDFDGFLTGQYDSEVDKYTVNLGGNSFSFKLIPDGNGDYDAYYLSRHNYKVKINMRSYPNREVGSLEITDGNGVIYFFDIDNREQVKDINPEHPYQVDLTTSWLLSKIQYLNNQEIVFHYQEDDTYESWDYSASAYLWDGHVPNPSTGGGIFEGIIRDYNDSMRKTEMIRQILTGITFPKGRMEFTHISKGLNREVFSQITVKDHTNSLVDTYTLEYESVRDALTKIEKNSESYFDFEYYGIHTAPAGIPAFYQNYFTLPRDQDFYKFYNGTGNIMSINIGILGSQANKSPSHNHTRLGALYKIIYPTGGHTKVHYEQNQLKEEYGTGGGIDTGDTSFNTFVDVAVDLTPIMNVELVDTKTFTIEHPVVAALYHDIEGTVRDGSYIRAYITTADVDVAQYNGCYSSPPNYSSSYYPMIIADARNKIQPPDPEDINCQWYPLPIVSPTILSEAMGPENCPYFPPTGDYSTAMGCTSDWTVDQHGNSGGDFWLPAGTYTLSVWGMRRVFDTELKANINLRYYDPPSGNGETTYENVDIGGLRVKRIDHRSAQDLITKISYDYDDDDGYSTAFENQKPLTVNKNDLFWRLGGQNFHRVENSYTLNSFGSLNAANGVPVYYKRIKKSTTSYGPEGVSGSAYSEGYSMYNYVPPRELVDYVYPLRPRHIDKSRASLMLEENFTDTGNLVQSTNLDYQEVRHWLEIPNNNPNETNMLNEYDENDDHPWSFKIALKKIRDLNWDTHCYNPPSGGPRDKSRFDCHWNYKLLHTWVKYREVEKDLYVNEKIQYNQGVTSTERTSRTQDSNYLPAEITMDSSDNESIVTSFEYANNIPTESQYLGMTSRNQIGIPVRTKSFRDGALLATQKTGFSLEGAGYRPNNIMSSKGTNTLETRVLIEDYDDVGNVTQVRKLGGEVISYLYSYDKNYVVAEIRGATFSEAIVALPSGTNYNTTFQNLNETALISALDHLQNSLTNAQISYYTYKPLIGISTMTNPRGYSMSYHYNNQNRLEFIKDEEGNTLEEYEYNYKTN